MIDDFIPEDNEYYRKFYEKQKKGSCGIACVAVYFHKNIKDVLRVDFPNYKGHMSIRDLHSLLILKYGLQCKWRNNHCKKTINLPPNKSAFARIQWVGKGGKFHGYSSWHEASCNTHFILIDADRFFTNDGGWAEIRWLPEYLEPGYITSYIEVPR
ncbi:hypothetical protein LCGC14_1192060 [marine sediment metagenome]|uniref:Peptidase C39-like domain-containing protein n=1 Tax=marine sediment metagenome TaxID=412755 RepID=A0A0F9M6W0_9ZZZZ|nr:hypothetical protein [Candidatus Aminicenantes bacterium]